MTRIHGNKLSQTETCNLDKSFNKIKIPFACKTKLSTVHINYRDDVSYQSSMYIITYTRAKWLIIQSNLVLCSLRFTCKPLTRNSPFPLPYIFTTVLCNFSFFLFPFFFSFFFFFTSQENCSKVVALERRMIYYTLLLVCPLIVASINAEQNV